MAARALTVKQMDKVVREREGEPTDPKALGPDEMRLYSYYKPGLVAGNYAITAKQTITSPSNWGQEELTVQNCLVGASAAKDAPQQFQVVVPRFSLDPEIINSYYPPDGHQDEGRILPHIVLNDPHYPWEILAGTSNNLKGPIDLDPRAGLSERALKRNLVPWVALVVFDPEELRFDKVEEASAVGLTGFKVEGDLQSQHPKGIFTMKVGEYFGLPAASRINYPNDSAYAELKNTPGNVDVIFPSTKLFKDLFGAPPDANVAMNVESQKYLAHVRHINTIGFPDAGVEDEGLYSIVVSSRTGKLDIDQPHTQICHLVSLEHVDATLSSLGDQSSTSSSGRIGMVSLFSWIYTALPPNPVNFVDTVRHLVMNQQVLNVDMSVFGQLDTSKPGAAIVAQRLKQGYTLCRWRTQSGEETAAFNRGPLVPGPVPYPVAKDIPDCSNTSQDYQVLDPQTGLMDLTYSSAWQLGKISAISDTVFSSALMRFRSIVHNSSVHETQMTISPMDPADASVAKIQQLVSNLTTMTAGDTGDPARFQPPTTKTSAPALQDPELKPLLDANLQDAIKLHASAGDMIYNEFNLEKGNNSDWAIIHSWLCEKLCLGGIPPQYLLPEPTFLPQESLRFFHIDDFWLDCFIDGALSVANHLDSDDDQTRRLIKGTFNTYLESIVPRAGYKPQIPCYGFLIRSKLIKAMPDLRITVNWKPVLDSQGKPVKDDRASVCRWTKWDDETLMALLDRQPNELDHVILAQPPHQQRFSLGSYVRKGDGKTSNLVEFDLRTLYTSENHPEEWPPKAIDENKPNTWLNFETRVLRVSTMAKDINEALRFPVTKGEAPATNGEAYSDPIPNSCELGLELNDPSYYFKITPPPPNDFKPSLAVQRHRRLYVQSTSKLSVAEAAETVLNALNARPPGVDSSAPLLKATPQAMKLQATLPTATATASKLMPIPTLKPLNSRTRLQPIPISRLGSNFKLGSWPFTTFSKFQLKIYPDYRPAPTRYGLLERYDADDYIPTLNQYFFDLIFSIQKTQNSEQDLLRIDIDIPMRAEPPDRWHEALLESSYDGPGLRMLSNQRFIPFLYYSETAQPDATADNLHIELVPRAADDGTTIKLNDRKTSEISFRLAEAPVSKLEVQTPVNVDWKVVPRGKVVVTMTEWYKTRWYPQGEPVKSAYVLLKKAVMDDKD